MHFSKALPIDFQQIRNPSIALTAARSSAIFRASSLTSSTCTPRIQSTRAKLAERASRPNRTSQRTRRFTQVKTDRPRPSEASCSPQRSSHYTYYVVLSQVRGRSNAWCATSGFGRRRICKSTRPPTPQRPRSSARCVTRHSATSPTSTRTWQRTVT